MGDYRKIKRILKTYREELPRLGRGNQLQRAVCFITAHLFDPKLTVNWVERRCQIHCKSFPTQFALSTGYRPKAYILHHRINPAKLLLQQTEASVRMVALSVGLGLFWR